MGNVDLLRSIPKPKRSVNDRAAAKSDDHVRISRQYGADYFDGAREYGYGGYKYDGRWVAVANDVIRHFSLKPGDRVLDVGCAKGFLVRDLLDREIEAFGLDVSKYALLHAEAAVVGRLHLGSAEDLPFPDRSFDAVLSINTLHNLPRDRCLNAVREIERLAPGQGFIQVDSYETPQQKAVFEDWVLTAMYHGYPDEWIELFEEAGYTGDWHWTIIE
jgi:ubiquinone/menaquinone biosynthesis C-methylase UbiE